MAKQRKEKEKTGVSFFTRFLKRLLLIAVICGVIGGLVIGVLNAIVMMPGRQRILTPEEAVKLENVDCILVLGCFVQSDGTPSHMLHDRVMEGVSLYRNGAAPVLFMTGDSRYEGYDETGTMRDLAVANGVPIEAITVDPYGLSTYDSVIRAAAVFGYRRVLIVTQEYHLYRALYIAESCGLEAYGVASDPRAYAGQVFRELREVAARVKDFLFCLFAPTPEMGEELPA